MRGGVTKGDLADAAHMAGKQAPNTHCRDENAGNTNGSSPAQREDPPSAPCVDPFAHAIAMAESLLQSLKYQQAALHATNPAPPVGCISAETIAKAAAAAATAATLSLMAQLSATGQLASTVAPLAVDQDGTEPALAELSARKLSPPPSARPPLQQHSSWPGSTGYLTPYIPPRTAACNGNEDGFLDSRSSAGGSLQSVASEPACRNRRGRVRQPAVAQAHAEAQAPGAEAAEAVAKPEAVSEAPVDATTDSSAESAGRCSPASTVIVSPVSSVRFADPRGGDISSVSRAACATRTLAPSPLASAARAQPAVVEPAANADDSSGWHECSCSWTGRSAVPVYAEARRRFEGHAGGQPLALEDCAVRRSALPPSEQWTQEGSPIAGDGATPAASLLLYTPTCAATPGCVMNRAPPTPVSSRLLTGEIALLSEPISAELGADDVMRCERRQPPRAAILAWLSGARAGRYSVGLCENLGERRAVQHRHAHRMGSAPRTHADPARCVARRYAEWYELAQSLRHSVPTSRALAFPPKRPAAGLEPRRNCCLPVPVTT